MSIMSLEEASKKEVQQQNGNFNLRSICIMLRPYQQEKITDPIMKLQGSPVSGKINIIEGPAAAGKTTAIVLGLNQSISLNVSEEIQKFISAEIKTSIRELVGALNRIVSFSRIYNKVPTISETKVILKDLLNLDLRYLL